MYDTGEPIGLFKGFSPSPRELQVEVIVPHGKGGMPSFGEFILIEMESDKATVGRVIQYHPTGPLTTKEGESYMAEMGKGGTEFPEKVRELVLRYSMTVALLGILKKEGEGKFKFEPGVRSLADLGKYVKRPSLDALKYLANAGLVRDPDSKSTVIFGKLALATHVRSDIDVYFDIKRLKQKRTFVFARAGYGKSNLIKYLLSRLYESPPDVGLLIFDPEGEYALPNRVGEMEIPGLASIPELRKKIAYYTNRDKPREFPDIYMGTVGLNFGDFSGRAILNAFVPLEKHDQVWANWIKGAKEDRWKELINLLQKDRYRAKDEDIKRILKIELSEDKDKKNVSIGAIKNNLIPPIERSHNPDSKLAKDLIEDLLKGKIIIVDISLLSSEDGLGIASLLMEKIFFHNIKTFTEQELSNKVKVLVVLEEAQSILGNRNLSDKSIFVRWVKEGRKFDLGAVLITQQPGSIAQEILSQGDNFFVMHLLNKDDLDTLNRVNAHFAPDILEQIRYEPIKGNCFFWSAPDQPYVVCAKVRNFDDIANESKEDKTVREEKIPEKKSDSQDILSEACKKEVNCDTDLWVFKVKGQDKYLVSRGFLINRLRRKLGGLKEDKVDKAIRKLKWDLAFDAILVSSRGSEQVVVLPAEDWNPEGGKKVEREVEIRKRE